MASSFRHNSWASSAILRSQIDIADVKDEDVELWVIRCPPGFDVSRLHGQTINVADASECSNTTDSSSGNRVIIRPTPACESEELICALPSMKKQRYVVSKPFAKQFAVTEEIGHVASGAVSAVPAQLPPVPQLPGLRLRNRNAESIPSTARKRGVELGAGHAAEEKEKARKASKAARKAAKAAKRAAAAR